MRYQARTCEVVYTRLGPQQTGITVMPDEEKQILEGIRRNVIEMNRRLNDISRFVGMSCLVGVVACILLGLILWRAW